MKKTSMFAMALATAAVAFGNTAPDMRVVAGGKAQRVEKMRCSAMPVNIRWPGHQRERDQTEICTFARFDLAAPVEIVVTPPRAFTNAVVRPVSKKVAVARDGNAVRFTLAKPGAYSVEFDGRHENLMLFADAPRDFADVDKKAANVRYFGPGEHDAGVIAMKPHETLFIDEGATVYGRVEAHDAPGIRICGKGILDGSRVKEEPIEIDPKLAEEQRKKGWAITNCKRFYEIDLHYCDDVRIEGVTIRDAQIYAIRPVCCNGFTADNVKIVGSWRYNSDGIDMHNCRRVRIRDCFIRTYDDSICIKGFDYCLPESEMTHKGVVHDLFEDVLVERCTIWNDWGRALEIGAETRAKEIRNVTFRDCDVLAHHAVALDVQNCDQAHVHHVTFENVRVEYDPDQPKTVMSASAKDFDPKSRCNPPALAGAVIHYVAEYSKPGAENRGRTTDLAFRDVDVYAPKMPGGFLRGFDADHRVERVTFEGIRLNGKDVTKEFVAGLWTNEFVSIGRTGPWPKEKAWAWHDAQPWLRGCNYMPASAANRVDQWQSHGAEARFAEVEREFALAREVGFNAMRLLLLEEGFAVWLQEHDAFMANFERYLALMEKYGMRALVCLGNDCSRPKRVWSLPKLGEQPYDVGYHGGRKKTQHGGFPGEPGFIAVDDPDLRVKFFAMCRELMTTYAHDKRVAIWELWNEPGAGNRGDLSLPILRDLFKLGWEIDPEQPISANVWVASTGRLMRGEEPTAVEKLAADCSDVITYHGYHSLADQVKLCDILAKRWERPLYNTEWLFRITGCDFVDNYAFFQQRKIGSFNWGFVNGKYQTHEPYEPMWTSKLEWCGYGDVTKWMHDLFRISHHPYDPYEIAAAQRLNAEADADVRGESLRAKVRKLCEVTGEDMWYGYRRLHFKFQGRDAWIVEPSTKPAAGTPWTWTMQWAEAFVDRTGVLETLKRGWHHVTIDLMETRMDEQGLAAAAAFQKFLVERLGFAPKAHLVGMSWGGFFSTRYAATHPANVAKIYLDAPLLNFDVFAKNTPGRIGVWESKAPADGNWSKDPRMPINLVEPIAKAGIPILLAYGGQDQTVPPPLNSETFIERFKAAGGKIDVRLRGGFGHHPHGFDPDKTGVVVDFFEAGRR